MIFKLDHFLPKSLINGSVWSSLIWGVFSSMSKAEPGGEKLRSVYEFHMNVQSECERKLISCMQTARLSKSLYHPFSSMSKTEPTERNRTIRRIGHGAEKGLWQWLSITWLWCGLPWLLANGRRRPHKISLVGELEEAGVVGDQGVGPLWGALSPLPLAAQCYVASLLLLVQQVLIE